MSARPPGAEAVAHARALSQQAVVLDEAGEKQEAAKLYTTAVNLITHGLSGLKDKAQVAQLKAVRKQYCARIVALGGQKPSLSASSDAVKSTVQKFEAELAAAIAANDAAGKKGLGRLQAAGGMVMAAHKSVAERSLAPVVQLASAQALQPSKTRERTRKQVALFSPRGSRLDGTMTPFDRVMNFANSVVFQTALYISFVVVFQNLANTMRLPRARLPSCSRLP